MSVNTVMNTSVTDCRFVKISVFNENYSALDDEGRVYCFGMK